MTKKITAVLFVLTAIVSTAQEIEIVKNSCLKEIGFETDMKQIGGDWEVEPLDDGITQYSYKDYDNRWCHEIFGIYFDTFEVVQFEESANQFWFTKFFDADFNDLNPDDLTAYLKNNFIKTFGNAQNSDFDGTYEEELVGVDSQEWMWIYKGVKYVLIRKTVGGNKGSINLHISKS